MSSQYGWDDYVLDLDKFQLQRAGEPVPLEPKALNVLAFLVARPGRLVTKQELFDAVWPETAVTDHALTRVIAQLRRALGDEAREARYIETVPTRGYRWIRELNPQNRPSPASAAPARATTITTLPTSPDGQATTAGAREIAAPRRGTHRVWWVAAALLAAVVLTLAALLSTPNATSIANDTVRSTGRHAIAWPVQLTTRDGLDLQPALAPAGDALAFVSDQTGSLEIYVRALDESAVDIALTDDGAQNVQPAWSPDGRYIAYHSYRHGGIWVIPSRGGAPRQLAVQGSNPAWSPDGGRIAFQSDEHADVTPSAWGAQTGSTLWSVNTDGTELTALTTEGAPKGGHAAPTWSRDGRFIAFTVFEGDIENGVWLLDLATKSTRPLARGPGLYELVFAPDGRAIYAAGGEAFIMRIGFDPVTGTATAERELIPIAGVPGVRGLSISHDGRTLSFAGLSLSSQIWAQPIHADGTSAGAAFAITRGTSRRNSVATVSPDGTRIAYMSTRGGAAPDVWVINVDGSNPYSLTSDESSDGKPTWFRDGSRIAYLSNRNNMLGVWAVDIATRRHELLFDNSRVPESKGTPDVGRLAELHLAPSLTKFAFTALAPPLGRRRVYIASFHPFTTRAITDGRESVGYPAWSPDERFLAVEVKEGSSMHAAVIDLDTGAMRRLTNERGQTWVRSWSPDSRKVAMAVLRDGRWSLRWIDVVTGREETITPALPPHIYLRYPEWSPRGDLVVFERGELRGNIWSVALRN